MARRPINGNGREKFQCLVAAASDRLSPGERYGRR